jgi:hypothetical protein
MQTSASYRDVFGGIIGNAISKNQTPNECGRGEGSRTFGLGSDRSSQHMVESDQEEHTFGKGCRSMHTQHIISYVGNELVMG